MSAVEPTESRNPSPPPFLCAGAAALGGAPVTGVSSPAGEIAPMIALLLLFVGAGAWMFARYRPAPVQPPVQPEPPAGAAPAREPALA